MEGRKIEIDFLLYENYNVEGYFPAYHMNKTSWITVALDGSVPDDEVKLLLDMSFEATAPKMRKKNIEEKGVRCLGIFEYYLIWVKDHIGVRHHKLMSGRITKVNADFYRYFIWYLLLASV